MWDRLMEQASGTPLEPIIALLRHYEVDLVPDPKTGYKIVPRPEATDWEYFRQEILMPVKNELTSLLKEVAKQDELIREDNNKQEKVITLYERQKPGGEWSFSRLQKFNDCPRSYYFRYVLGLPEMETWALQFGKLVHETIAKMLASGGEAGEIAIKKAGQYPLLEADDIKAATEMANKFVRAYVPMGRLSLERPLRGSIDGYSLIGYADLLEEGIESLVITDLKTNWRPYEIEETAQLGLYAYLAQQEFGDKPIMLRLWFLRYSPRNAVKTAFATPEIVANAIQWVKNTIAAIQEAQELPGPAGFEPRPGTSCQGCGYALKCLGLDSELESRGVDLKDEPSESLAGLILRLEAGLNALKKELKARVFTSGPVVINDQIFDNWQKSVWRFKDLNRFFELLQSQGEDPWNYLAVDGFKLKKLLNSWVGEKLKEIGEEKITTYFGHRGII